MLIPYFRTRGQHWRIRHQQPLKNLIFVRTELLSSFRDPGSFGRALVWLSQYTGPVIILESELVSIQPGQSVTRERRELAISPLSGAMPSPESYGNGHIGNYIQ